MDTQLFCGDKVRSRQERWRNAFTFQHPPSTKGKVGFANTFQHEAMQEHSQTLPLVLFSLFSLIFISQTTYWVHHNPVPVISIPILMQNTLVILRIMKRKSQSPIGYHVISKRKSWTKGLLPQIVCIIRYLYLCILQGIKLPHILLCICLYWKLEKEYKFVLGLLQPYVSFLDLALCRKFLLCLWKITHVWGLLVEVYC